MNDLYLKLPGNKDNIHDAATILLEDAPHRLPKPTIVPREEVSLEEIADHLHFCFLTLGEKIGIGGLAAVYRMMLHDDTLFALKVPLKANRRAYEHFTIEARLLRDLHKEQAPVPELVSHGISAGFPYLLMGDLGPDYLHVPHITLTKYATVDKATRIALRVCDALQALHRRGYRHNDIKSANIHYGFSGDVHLLDFASATPLDSVEDTHVFSPLYLAPERVTHEFPVSAAVDVFGLGVTLYEILAKDCPFKAAQQLRSIPDIHEHIHLVRTRGYAPLLGYTPKLTHLVYAMLSHNPAERPSIHSIREVLGDIRKEYFE
jgi:serine/threonine protein kinase